MDDYDLDSVASVLSECMQYSGNEDLSDLDRILLSLKSSSSHVGDLLDEILVTRQKQAHDGLAKLRSMTLSPTWTTPSFSRSDCCRRGINSTVT